MLVAAVGLAEEPSGPAAARGAVAAACAQLGVAARAVVVFATHGHDPRALAQAACAATEAHVLGCVASGVIAGGQEVEDGAAVAAMALGGDAPLVPFFLGGPAEV